jgi:hypothetical protein
MKCDKRNLTTKGTKRGRLKKRLEKHRIVCEATVDSLGEEIDDDSPHHALEHPSVPASPSIHTMVPTHEVNDPLCVASLCVDAQSIDSKVRPVAVYVQFDVEVACVQSLVDCVGRVIVVTYLPQLVHCSQ